VYVHLTGIFSGVNDLRLLLEVRSTSQSWLACRGFESLCGLFVREQRKGVVDGDIGFEETDRRSVIS